MKWTSETLRFARIVLFQCPVTRLLRQKMIKSDSRPTLGPKRAREDVAREEKGLRARVDAPHPVAELLSQSGAEAAVESAVAQRCSVAPPVADEPPSEQLRLQALQLATHLRDRQKELDAREAELNSRVAQWENEARAVRLSLAEREADMAVGAETLAHERSEFHSRSQLLVDSETQVSSYQKQLSERERRLSERERKLSERERDVNRRLARLATVEAAQHDRGPASKRGAAVSSDATLREQLAQEYRLALADLQQKREEVGRRAEHLHQCRLSLGRTRDELTRLHQDTLEMRLAMEELWVQLSGAAPPAALIQSLGRIRAKLAEQSSQAHTELCEERKELERLRGELAAEHETLAQRKEQFERWAASRTENCQQEASRLLAREEQLRRREVLHREQSQRWAAERLRYQHEVHRLHAELRTCQQAAAGSTLQEGD
jgi:hypothetical protein